MTIVKTNLPSYRESAKTERFMPNTSIRATNVQDAIVAVAAQPKVIAPKIITAADLVAGIYAVQPGDTYLRVNVAAPVTIQLPTAASRGGLPLIIKDGSSLAGANNITIVANGADTIDTLAQVVINQDSGGFTLDPVTVANSWDIV